MNSLPYSNLQGAFRSYNLRIQLSKNFNEKQLLRFSEERRFDQLENEIQILEKAIFLIEEHELEVEGINDDYELDVSRLKQRLADEEASAISRKAAADAQAAKKKRDAQERSRRALEQKKEDAQKRIRAKEKKRKEAEKKRWIIIRTPFGTIKEKKPFFIRLFEQLTKELNELNRNIGRELTTFKKNIDNELTKAKQNVDRELTDTKKNIDRELTTAKQNVDRELTERKADIDRELTTAKANLDRELSALKVNIDRELTITKTNLDRELTTAKENLDRELTTARENAEREVEETFEKLKSVIETYSEPKNLLRLAIVYAASVYGGPMGAAFANSILDKLENPNMSEEDLLRSFCVGAVASYAGQNASSLGVSQSVARSIGQDVGEVVFKGKVFSAEEFVTGIATNSIEVSDVLEVDNPVVHSALVSAKNVAVSQMVAGEAINLEEIGDAFIEGAAKSMVDQVVESVVDSVIEEAESIVMKLKNHIDPIEKLINDSLDSLPVEQINKIKDDLEELKNAINEQAAQLSFSKSYNQLLPEQLISIEFMNAIDDAAVSLSKNADWADSELARLVETESSRSPAAIVPVINIGIRALSAGLAAYDAYNKYELAKEISDELEEGATIGEVIRSRQDEIIIEVATTVGVATLLKGAIKTSNIVKANMSMIDDGFKINNPYPKGVDLKAPDNHPLAKYPYDDRVINSKDPQHDFPFYIDQFVEENKKFIRKDKHGIEHNVWYVRGSAKTGNWRTYNEGNPLREEFKEGIYEFMINKKNGTLHHRQFKSFKRLPEEERIQLRSLGEDIPQ
ncbi:hypothetical protein KMW28_05575 [Flammeovirga yaeyamensis]|uniref:Uncharacterized protein n=1 Tax=Flammeovirga yaeyamensis TaxID=367791 RepID=A0AAX1N735_9BACT|nr:hypothetical protein [Flammeovirga yaeyamensis]MBB3697635.1 hypothetical protein [Flammeovirga yaeyamensis]NMF36004.1 hypothetical protein [Flammeovirga yaeyamensis]QWG03051.1 hypothetical protein KMW28_05575 [Flammeovirga yaeyamensis]